MAAAANLLIQPFVFEKQPALLLLTPASLAPNRMAYVLWAVHQGKTDIRRRVALWMKGTHQELCGTLMPKYLADLIGWQQRSWTSNPRCALSRVPEASLCASPHR